MSRGRWTTTTHGADPSAKFLSAVQAGMSTYREIMIFPVGCGWRVSTAGLRFLTIPPAPWQADRDVGQLSGGELQRLAVAVTCLKAADVYMFDEPSSYLDVKQRVKVAPRTLPFVLYAIHPNPNQHFVVGPSENKAFFLLVWHTFVPFEVTLGSILVSQGITRKPHFGPTFQS